MSLLHFYRCSAAALLLAGLSSAHAQLRLLDNHTPVVQYGNDDDSTDALALGFSVNLFGVNYSELFLNNNGNVTFAFPSGLANPSSINGGLAEQGGPVLAPYFADVDTTYTGTLSYGTGTIGAHQAFVATWTDVMAFSAGARPTAFNTFQLFLVDRSDTGVGNFDFEFNYTQIQWDEGANSLITALAGYSDAAATTFLLPGSGVSGAFLDSGPSGTALIHNSLGVPFDDASMNGRYAFNVRDGLVSFIPPGGGAITPVPEPSTYGLLGGALLSVVVLCRRSKRGDAIK